MEEKKYWWYKFKATDYNYPLVKEREAVSDFHPFEEIRRMNSSSNMGGLFYILENFKEISKDEFDLFKELNKDIYRNGGI